MNDFSQTHKKYNGKLQAAILDWAGTAVD